MMSLFWLFGALVNLQIYLPWFLHVNSITVLSYYIILYRIQLQYDKIKRKTEILSYCN